MKQKGLKAPKPQAGKWQTRDSYEKNAEEETQNY